MFMAKFKYFLYELSFVGLEQRYRMQTKLNICKIIKFMENFFTFLRNLVCSILDVHYITSVSFKSIYQIETEYH